MAIAFNGLTGKFDLVTPAPPAPPVGGTISTYILRDDFVTGTTTNGSIGEMGWSTGGSNPSVAVNNHSNFYGTVDVQANAPNSSGYIAPVSTQSGITLITNFDCYIRVGLNQITNISVFCGIADDPSLFYSSFSGGTGTTGANAAAFILDGSGVNVSSSHWGFLSQSTSGGTNYADTGVQVVGGGSTPFLFRFRSISAGTIMYSVNGGSESTIPWVPSSSSQLVPFVGVYSLSLTTGRTVIVDYYGLQAATGR